MHHAGLDDANHFLLKAGDGFFNHLDEINPTGHALKFFHDLGQNEIPIEGIRPGDMNHDVSAIAAYDDDRITIMLAKFFGVSDTRSTQIKIALEEIKELIDSDVFTIKTKLINENVSTGDETVDTTYNVWLTDDQLELTIDLKPNTSLFIEIDTSKIEDIISGTMEDTKSNLNIYPNPSSGVFHLEHDLLGGIQIKVYNLKGSLVYQSKDYDHQVDLKHLNDDVYFVELTNDDLTIRKEIIISGNTNGR